MNAATFSRYTELNQSEDCNSTRELTAYRLQLPEANHPSGLLAFPFLQIAASRFDPERPLATGS